MENFFVFIFLIYFCSLGTQDDVIEIINSEGYLGELHSVVTDDEYILNIHRIRAPKSTSKIVLIMHGIQLSSFAFVYGRRQYSLAFQLADDGYDIWIGNARGTEFSRKHQTLDSNSSEFWDFSFHEIAIYDLPAIIDNILIKTNRTALHYIGNSQGTTIIIALLAERPEFNKKMLTLHLMTPVVFSANMFPWLKNVRALVDVVTTLGSITNISKEIFTVDSNTRNNLANMCNLKSEITYNMCKNYFFVIAGRSPEQWNDKLFINITNLFEHLPNSVSLRQILHYMQLFADVQGRFLKFEYSRTKNHLLYNQSEPPEYNLRNVRAKMHILYGTNDNIANFKDVENLIKYFRPMIIGIDKMIGWNHADFIMAKDIHVITKKITCLMSRYSNI